MSAESVPPVAQVLETLRRRAEAAPGEWQKAPASAGDARLMLGWRADPDSQHRIAIRAVPDGAQVGHVRMLEGLLPDPSLRLVRVNWPQQGTAVLYVSLAALRCGECGEVLDVVARAAGSGTCSGCALATGDLQPLGGFFVHIAPKTQ